MSKILLLNHNSQRCGVADYGRRLFAILKPHMDIDYCDTIPDFTGYDIALYNYHYATQPNASSENRSVKHIALFHEAFLNFSPDEVINVTDLPRPLFENLNLPTVVNEVPVIGSFGFGFPDKDFPRICKLVVQQYHEAIIRFNIPFAQFGDDNGYLAKSEVEKCKKKLSGTNIKLEVNHNFLPDNDLLQWLNGNDINLFLYKESHGRGISSSTDYALSVRKPIGISNSEMFRHLPKDICVDNILLKDLTIDPLRQVYEHNSNQRLVDTIKDLIY